MKTGKITFQIFYADGILPEVFPEARAKMTRAEKAAMKVNAQAESDVTPEATSASSTKETATKSAPAATEESSSRKLPAVIIEPTAFFKPEETPTTTIKETTVLESSIEKAAEKVPAEKNS